MIDSNHDNIQILDIHQYLYVRQKKEKEIATGEKHLTMKQTKKKLTTFKLKKQ